MLKPRSMIRSRQRRRSLMLFPAPLTKQRVNGLLDFTTMTRRHKGQPKAEVLTTDYADTNGMNAADGDARAIRYLSVRSVVKSVFGVLNSGWAVRVISCISWAIIPEVFTTKHTNYTKGGNGRGKARSQSGLPTEYAEDTEEINPDGGFFNHRLHRYERDECSGCSGVF